MNELARVQDRRAAARQTTTDEWNGSVPGRHAFDEDAVLTPIFHALQRGGWRSRQHEAAAPSLRESSRDPVPDPVDEFRRDPLTAPIPVQVLVPAPSRSSERRSVVQTEGRVDTSDRGRHHRRRESVGSAY